MSGNTGIKVIKIEGKTREQVINDPNYIFSEWTEQAQAALVDG